MLNLIALTLLLMSGRASDVELKEGHAIADATPNDGGNTNIAVIVKKDNKTLNGEACRLYILHVEAHSGGFWDQSNLDYYNRCLWVLRHASEMVFPKQIAIGGWHYPTVIVTNHRDPAMKLPLETKSRKQRHLYSEIPLQTFQDTQSSYMLPELGVPHHFILPFFDVNIGNAIKNQGSMNHYQSYQMQSMLRSGDTVLDVGANLGCYTIALAEALSPTGRVFAFEPFRWMHQILTANVAANGLQNVWPVQAALGRTPELMRLFPPQFRFFSSPGGVHVDGQSKQINSRPIMEMFQLYDLAPDREAELVRIVRLDDLVLHDEGQWWGLPAPISDLRLIKIDVEGMETAVIEGAAVTIRTFRPIIWSENNGYFDSNGKDTRFLEVMANLGYACSKLESAPTDLICTDHTGAGHQI